MSLPRTLKSAKPHADHSGIYALLIALPLTLAGTAFLTFLADAGARIGF